MTPLRRRAWPSKIQARIPDERRSPGDRIPAALIVITRPLGDPVFAGSQTVYTEFQASSELGLTPSAPPRSRSLRRVDSISDLI